MTHLCKGAIIEEGVPKSLTYRMDHAFSDGKPEYLNIVIYSSESDEAPMYLDGENQLFSSSYYAD